MRTHLLPVGLLILLATSSAIGQGFNLSYGSDPHLLFDWYVPSTGTGPFPCVVYIHGGPGDKSDAPFWEGSLPDLYLKNGITLMAINHRPWPTFAYPAQVEDSAKAVQFFRENAATYNIDPDRLAIWGVSAGATMGGWLAYGPDYANPNGSSQEQRSSRPQALINISGLTNFLLMAPTFPSFMVGTSTLGELDPLFLESVSVSEMVVDVTRTFTPPVVSFYGSAENPPPLMNPHDATLMKDLHQKLEAFPAVHAKSRMIQQVEGVPNNSYEEITAWLLKRFDVPHQLNLGRSLAGTAGIAPQLEATGNWAPGGSVAVSFQSSTGTATTVWALASHTAVNLPFAGGILVPEPTSLFVLFTPPSGTLALSTTLPAWVGNGQEFYLQFWQPDPQGPQGYAASNAVLAMTGL
ncbi:MAG TPA: alpha/beta hydrolase [Candidatus Limnocylindrales bacterium]|nr:alpha/beta hydrolase [Candidatus Limnocylindrales bacterium]